MTVTGATRKSYTPHYRREAARLVIDTDRMIAEVAREIGVGEQLLGRWLAAERARMEDPPPALDADERAELERLRALGREVPDHGADLPGRVGPVTPFLALPPMLRRVICTTNSIESGRR